MAVQKKAKQPAERKGAGKEQALLKKPRRKARVERLLKKREPLLVENTKKSLFIRGHRTSELTNDTLKDFAMLCKPHSKALQRKNEILPFEDCKSIEFLSEKNDSSLFAFASHTKKRPHNLILVCANPMLLVLCCAHCCLCIITILTLSLALSLSAGSIVRWRGSRYG